MNIDRFLDNSSRRVNPKREGETEPSTDGSPIDFGLSYRSQSFANVINNKMPEYYSSLEAEDDTRRSINKTLNIATEYVNNLGSKNDKHEMLKLGQINLPEITIGDEILQVSITSDQASQLVVRVSAIDENALKPESVYYLVRDINNGITAINDQFDSWTTDDVDYANVVHQVQTQLNQYSDMLNGIIYRETIRAIPGGEAE